MSLFEGMLGFLLDYDVSYFISSLRAYGGCQYGHIVFHYLPWNIRWTPLPTTEHRIFRQTLV